MPKTKPYDLYAKKYDSWYDENKNLYETEIKAVKKFIPLKGKGVDIGTGTGRFALPFGIKIGIEPSVSMGKIASKRGLKVLNGVAENLALKDNSFDYALMIAVICFLDDVQKAFDEAFRILKNGGNLIVSHIEKESFLGKIYAENKDNDPFLKEAVLLDTKEVINLLKKSGFGSILFNQTIFEEYQGKDVLQPVLAGYGKGAFVTLRALKFK